MNMKWTTEIVGKMIRLRNAGCTTPEVAAMLGMPESRAAEMWRDPTLTAADICAALNRGINDFYQLRSENPALFKPRRVRRIDEH